MVLPSPLRRSQVLGLVTVQVVSLSLSIVELQKDPAKSVCVCECEYACECVCVCDIRDWRRCPIHSSSLAAPPPGAAITV